MYFVFLAFDFGLSISSAVASVFYLQDIIKDTSTAADNSIPLLDKKWIYDYAFNTGVLVLFQAIMALERTYSIKNIIYKKPSRLTVQGFVLKSVLFEEIVEIGCIARQLVLTDYVEVRRLGTVSDGLLKATIITSIIEMGFGFVESIKPVLDYNNQTYEKDKISCKSLC